jgi:hypothetical protein
MFINVEGRLFLLWWEQFFFFRFYGMACEAKNVNGLQENREKIYNILWLLDPLQAQLSEEEKWRYSCL